MDRVLPKLVLSLAVGVLALAALFAGLRLWREHVAPGSGPRRAAATSVPAPDELPVQRGRTRGVEPLEAGAAPVFPPSSFVRWPVGPDVVARYFEIDQVLTEYDPFSYFRHLPHLEVQRLWGEHPEDEWTLRTNSLGLRMDREPAAEPPDLRVLVVGDSHTDGVCNNSEGYPALVEAALTTPERSVEVLNAAKGGHSFYNYLGTLERMLPLAPDVLVVCVYGGNDFEELLTWHHFFHRTDRPPGAALYSEQIERAQAISKPALAQAAVAAKYFDTRPGQIEQALQSARDVTGEIATTCRRFGVRPVFCYLPPATEVRWDDLAETLDGVARALELERSEFDVLGRMADSWIASTRASGLDVLDLRPAFRASDQPLYWRTDHHISLAGQALVAEQLTAHLREVWPDDAQRVRPAPLPRRRDDDEHRFALRSPGAYRPGATASLDRRRLPAAAAAKVHPLVDGEVFDEHALFRHGPNLDQARVLEEHPAGGWRLRTNSLGLRMDDELLEEPDVRVLVTGDGNVDGVCDNADGFPNLLAERLRASHPDLEVEALNAGKGGYSFYNYLGTLERFLPLAPDVFVMVVYGGNDFYEVLELHNFYGGQARPDESAAYWHLIEAALEREPQSLSQFFNPLKYFAEHRAQVAAAAWAASAVTDEIRRTCESRGIELVVVYLPPAIDVEWERLAGRLEPIRELLEIPPDRMGVIDVLAGAYLDELRADGVEVIDLRDVFALHSGPFYWSEDLHIDLNAQRLIAERLAASLGRLPIFQDR